MGWVFFFFLRLSQEYQTYIEMSLVIYEMAEITFAVTFTVHIEVTFTEYVINKGHFE